MNMPYLKIETSATLSKDERQSLLKKTSAVASQILGKSETWVMVSVSDEVPMIFGGDTAAAAYLELKSIGLSKDRCPELSRALCDHIQSELGIPAERIYIEFSNIDGPMFGWNRETF